MAEQSVYPYLQRLSANPDDGEALFVLWQYYGDRGEFQPLASLVEQLAGRRLDPVSSADLYFRAAELWSKNVGRLDKAVQCYGRAFELDASQLQAVEAARGLYEQLGDLPQAAQLYERQLAITGEPLVRLQLVRDLANLRARMGDPSGQAAALEEALRLQPDDYEVMRELAAAYLARADAPDGDLQDRMRAAHLLAQIARGLGGANLRPFCEAALEAWGGEETAFSLLRDLLLAEGRTDELAAREVAFLVAHPESSYVGLVRRELATFYVDAGQYDDALNALGPLIESDPSVTPLLLDLYARAGRNAERVALVAAMPPNPDRAQRTHDLREMAAVYAQAGDRAAMRKALRELLDYDPSDAEALEPLAEDLRRAKEHKPLRDLLWKAANAEGAALESRRRWLRDVAQLSAQQLDDSDTAVRALRMMFELFPDDEQAAVALQRALEKASRWDELATHFEQRAREAIEPAAARPHWEKAAELHRTRRKNPRAEAVALRELWELFPSDDALGDRLLDALRRGNDDEGISALLRQRAESAEEVPKAREFWTELALHLERKLGDPEEALRAWQRLTELEPEYSPAWEAAERILEHSGRIDLLLETLVAHAEVPAASARAHGLHLRAAEVARMLGDLGVAVTQAEKAHGLSPEDDATAGLLLDLYDATGDDQRLEQLLSDRAARAPEGPARVDLLRRKARFLARTQPAQAQAAWQAVRDAASTTDAGDDTEALSALVGLAEQERDYVRVASLLGLWAELEEAPAQVRLALRRAQVQEHHVGDAASALATLRGAAAGAARDQANVWSETARLAEQLGAAEIQAQALEQLLRLTEDDEQRAKLCERLVPVYSVALGQADKALSTLERWYDADPTDYSVVEQLALAHERAEHWGEVLKFREVLLEIEGDEEESSRLTLALAELAEHKAKDPRKALSLLDPRARQGDAAALEALRGLAERAGLHTELLATLESLAEAKGDPAGRAALWREIARRAKEHLRNARRALDAEAQALRLQPQDEEALGAIEQLAAQTRQTDIASRAYSVVIGAAAPARVAEFALRGAKWLSQYNQTGAALDLLLAAQQRDPLADALLDAIEEKARSTGRAEEFFLALDRRRKPVREEAERFRWLCRGATAVFGGVGSAEVGREYLEQALAHARAVKGGLEARLQTLRSALAAVPGGGSKALAGLVDVLVAAAEQDSEEDPRAAAELLMHGMVACEEDLGRGELAWNLGLRAVALWPSEDRAAARLDTLAAASGQVDTLVEHYGKVIDEAYDGVAARGLMERRAKLLDEHLGRTDEAVDALRQLVERVPRDAHARGLLRALLEKHSRHKDLLLALEQEQELGLGDKLELQRRIARVWQLGLKNPFEARSAWQRILKAAPGDAEATAALASLDRKRSAEPEDDEDLAPAPPPPMPVRAAMPQPLPARASDTVEDLDELEPEEVPTEPPVASEAALPAEDEETGPHSAPEPEPWEDDGPTRMVAAPPPDPSLDEEPEELAPVEDAGRVTSLDVGWGAEHTAPSLPRAPLEEAPGATEFAPVSALEAAAEASPRSGADSTQELDALEDEDAEHTPPQGVAAAPRGRPTPPPPSLRPPARPAPPPTSPLDDLEELEALDAIDAPSSEAHVAATEDLEPEPEELEELDDEPSLEDLARMAAPPKTRTSLPPPPPPRTVPPQRPPTLAPPPPPLSRTPRKS